MEEVGEGMEGTVGVLGVLDAVEVVHVVAPDDEEERGAARLRHTVKFHTEVAAPKHMARWNHSVRPCSVWRNVALCEGCRTGHWR